MTSDVLTSIKATLHGRISSPLFLTFILSWCAWKYRFLLVLLSDLSPMEKIHLIDASFFMNLDDIFFYGFLFPALSCLTIIFLYPYPAKATFRFWKARQCELIEIKKSLEDNALLTLEQSREIRRELAKLEIEHERITREKTNKIEEITSLIGEESDRYNSIIKEKDRLIQDKDNKISSLKEQVENLNIKPNQTKEANLNNTNENNQEGGEFNLPDMLDRIFRVFLSRGTEALQTKTIAQELKLNSIKAEYYLDQLAKISYLSKSGTDGPESWCKLTPKSKEYIVKSNMV